MIRRWRMARSEWIVVAALALITALIFGVIIGHMIYDVALSDYNGHIQFTIDLLQNHVISRPDLLFQALLIAITAAVPISLQSAALIVGVVFYEFAVLILYAMLRGVLPGSTPRLPLLSAALALSLLLVTPITLASLPAHDLYYGYVGINVLHNPTIVVLKPFALLLFALTLAVLNRQIALTARTLIVAFLLIFFSLLAKPNFVLTLLPALLVVIGWRVWRGDRAGLKAAILALIVPMVALLALLYVFTYVFIDAGASGIIFAPLLSVSIYEPSLARLAVKFLLSILFPLTVYLYYRRQAVRDLSLNLAWLIFLAGAGQMYLFAESGPRLTDGNFWWSAQIGLFILFVVSTLFWLRHFRELPRFRRSVCLTIFALHLISGLIFYLLSLQAPTMWAWW